MTLLHPRTGEWTARQTASLLAAAGSAPYSGYEAPWVIELPRHGVLLYERLAPRRHDPLGRNRLLACGAALTNIYTALRAFGWDVELTLGATNREPDRLALLRPRHRRAASEAELTRYDAIARVGRRGHPDPVPLLSPVDTQLLHRIADADWCPGTEARMLATPRTSVALGELVLHVARRCDGDRRVGGELAAWLGDATGTRDDDPHRPEDQPYCQAVSSVAARIAAERIIAVVTPDDGRVDQLMAGAAVQSMRLTAAAMGLVAVALTGVLTVPEFRSGLIERTQLGGFPQALVRVGRMPVLPRSARPVEHRFVRPLPIQW